MEGKTIFIEKNGVLEKQIKSIDGLSPEDFDCLWIFPGVDFKDMAAG
jgi:hypothetical protein